MHRIQNEARRLHRRPQPQQRPARARKDKKAIHHPKQQARRRKLLSQDAAILIPTPALSTPRSRIETDASASNFLFIPHPRVQKPWPARNGSKLYSCDPHSRCSAYVFSRYCIGLASWAMRFRVIVLLLLLLTSPGGVCASVPAALFLGGSEYTMLGCGSYIGTWPSSTIYHICP